jgi:hypothetical protein
MSAEALELGAPSALPIRDDPFVRGLVAKLPGQSAASFSDEQFLALKTALGGRSWGAHVIDLRWTLSFWHWHYYFVFLFGRNRRDLTRREREIQRIALALMLTGFVTVSTLFGILVLYLLKSAAGIDLIPGFSFGVWDWFQREFLR